MPLSQHRNCPADHQPSGLTPPAKVPGLDIEVAGQLLEYLNASQGIEASDVVDMEILKGGVSARTVKVSLRGDQQWVLKQALEKLRVDSEWFCDPGRIHREADAIRWFSEFVPSASVPALIFEDRSNHVIGMEAVRQPHRCLKEQLMRSGPDVDLIAQAGRLLGIIHGNGERFSDQVPEEFHDQSLFRSLRIDPFYVAASRGQPTFAHYLEELVHESARDKYTVVHGDFSPKNLLIKDNKLVLLDHEVIHFGDGMFDIGFFLSHLLSKANYKRESAEDYIKTSLAFVCSYKEVSNELSAERQSRAVRHTIGCLLARSLGKNPMKYLSAEKREWQAVAARRLMSGPTCDLVTFLAKYNQLLRDADD